MLVEHRLDSYIVTGPYLVISETTLQTFMFLAQLDLLIIVNLKNECEDICHCFLEVMLVNEIIKRQKKNPSGNSLLIFFE